MSLGSTELTRRAKACMLISLGAKNNVMQPKARVTFNMTGFKNSALDPELDVSAPTPRRMMRLKQIAQALSFSDKGELYILSTLAQKTDWQNKSVEKSPDRKNETQAIAKSCLGGSSIGELSYSTLLGSSVFPIRRNSVKRLMMPSLVS